MRNNRKFIPIIACCLALLAGCSRGGESATAFFSGSAQNTAAAEETTAATEPTVPPTVPADGNPDDVTCKGSYTTDTVETDAVVATIGQMQLTNGQLQVYYWMEVAAYQQAGNDIAPDFNRPLDTQVCELDDSVGSWQQYFLKCALNTWWGSQALALQGEEEGVPTEEAYQPNEKNHAEYLTNKPATRVLYGYNDSYQPNDMHQAYLDNIPTMLEELASEKGYAGISDMVRDSAGPAAGEEALAAYAQLVNRGYMYFVELGYDIAPTAEEVEAYFAENEAAYQQAGITRSSGKYVTMRHILLVPEAVQTEEGTSAQTVTVAGDGTVTCSEEDWEACRASAQALLDSYLKLGNKAVEARFAELANDNSDDTGTALNGGLYENLSQGQLTQVLDEWCFDEARQPGDTEIIRSDCGYHVVYFCGSTDIWYASAEEDLTRRMYADLFDTAMEKYPAIIDYSVIDLGAAERTGNVVSGDDLLYPDVAHERFPVVPLYLQQDYPTTMYGAYKIVTHGCGITTMAMLASYMADDAMTPPLMCERYADYCYKTGTDGRLFADAPAEMGFFLEKKTFDWREAKQAMAEGHIVVTVQQKGFWTRGGHYLVLEKMFEDELVQVRDSNIYNYGRLHDHKIDKFEWWTITPAGMAYWIYEYKITSIPACARCGSTEDAGAPEVMLTADYICGKCDTAMDRRENYIAACHSAA